MDEMKSHFRQHSTMGYYKLTLRTIQSNTAIGYVIIIIIIIIIIQRLPNSFLEDDRKANRR
jgi:hypothetical protein